MIARKSDGLRVAALVLGLSTLWAGRAAASPDGETLFGTGFETGDCIAWDLLVGGCEVDAQCPTQLRFFAVCEAETCVECLGDVDCLNNPTALGPTCGAGSRCGCASSTECAASPAGPVCDPVAGVCSCESDLECPPATECRPTPYLQGLTTCW